MPSPVARRLSTLASFYKYCEQEQLVDRNPALNVRRPKVDYESRTLGLDRNELGAFLVQADLGSPHDHAQSKDEDAEKAVAGDQEDDLPGVECEGIAPTLRREIAEPGFFLGHTALALSKVKPVK